MGIPIAASGWLHPTIAIAAMASSTLGILLNSFGLRRSRLTTCTVPPPEVSDCGGPSQEALPTLLHTLGQKQGIER